MVKAKRSRAGQLAIEAKKGDALRAMDAEEDRRLLDQVNGGTADLEDDALEPVTGERLLREAVLVVELDHASGVRLRLKLLPPENRSEALLLKKEDYEEALDELLDVAGSSELCSFAQAQIGSNVKVSVS